MYHRNNVISFFEGNPFMTAQGEDLDIKYYRFKSNAFVL